MVQSPMAQGQHPDIRVVRVLRSSKGENVDLTLTDRWLRREKLGDGERVQLYYVDSVWS